MSGAPAPLRDVAIIGGGCYGSFYAGQLLTARRRGGLLVRRILVVDQDPQCAGARLPGSELVASDWAGFLRGFLDAEPPGPVSLTTPWSPHP